MTERHSAALVIRVWLEGDAEHFRGRLTSVDTSGPDDRTSEHSVAAVSSPEATIDAVRQWLDDFLLHEHRSS